MENNQNFELGDLGEVSISYLRKGNLSQRPIISSKYDAIQVAWRVFDHDLIAIQEQFICIYLNRANKVIGTKAHFIGGQHSVTVDIKIILSTALRLMASSIIISHNHPSGSLIPSKNDIHLTTKMRQALDLLNIELIDHILICPEGNFKSLAESEYW